MIDNPVNGQVSETRVKDEDPTSDVQTATAVAEPGTPMTKPAPAAEAARDQSVPAAEPLSARTQPLSGADFSSELTKFRQSFEEIQAQFIGEPRAAVAKAEALIEGLMSGLHDQLQRIHGNLKPDTDTEQLRVAMLSYRDLFDSLGGHRPA